jgi:rRNA maturation endonuclease Nob1
MKKKVCKKCDLDFETNLHKCPVCGESLIEVMVEEEVANIVATTTFLKE